MPQRELGLVSISLAIGLVAALFGCVPPSQEIIDEASNSSKDFLLGPEDVLDVVVWKNEDLSQKAVVVRPDGKVSMPLIGEVQASGRTANQLASQIASAAVLGVAAPFFTPASCCSRDRSCSEVRTSF